MVSGIPLHLIAALSLATVIACGSGDPAEQTPSLGGEREQSIRALNLDLNACDTEPASDPRLRIIAHETAAGEHVATIEAALRKAMNNSGEAYGWTPREPVCVHLFASDAAFHFGLQHLAGWPPRYTHDRRNNLGTTARDLATGRPAIYMNLVVLPGDNWAAYLATHEYYHVVQAHLGPHFGCAGDTAWGPQGRLPNWFLEGMADWEATKQEGHPNSRWLTILLTEERDGRAPPFSGLVTWEQWKGVVKNSPLYYKARAALMYLEELAGPGAAHDLFSAGARGGWCKGFEAVFEEVSGLTFAEFEAGFLPFLERLAAAQPPPVGIP